MAMNRENEIIAEDKREFSAIDVDDGISFLAQRIRSLTPPQPLTLCSIYRVPDNLRKGNEDKYEPSVVSIGPYHRAKQNLNITEKHKLWYLRDFISRSTPPQTSLEDIVQAVKNLEEDARACYAEEIYLSSDDFVMMMVIDGCFILELFYRNYDDDRYSKEDIIYSAPWVIETVKQDLVLLENQLPFIILVCLYKLNTYPNRSLNDMVIRFFHLEYHSLIYHSMDIVEGSSHLLDFLRNCIIPAEFNLSTYPRLFIDYPDFPCAKELQEIGVKFKAKDGGWLLDVTFEEGYIALPPLVVKGIKFYLFPNWIALEQCHLRFKSYITSYTLLLGHLLQSKDDVKFLRETRIFYGNENEDEKFVTEINMLCQFVMLFYCNKS